MIPEPAHSGGQAVRRRNNNLLCLAIVLFLIGFAFIEATLSLWSIYDDPAVTFMLLSLLIFFGVLPALGGIYVMWRWWQSGSHG